MRSALLFAFFGLLATSFALRPNSATQSALNALEVSSSPDLRTVLHSLLQITEVSEYQEVDDILVKIRDELSALNTKLRTDAELAKTQCQESRDSYEKTICDLDDQIESSNDALTQQTTERDRLSAAISSSVSAISEAQEARDAEVLRRSNSKAAHEQTLIDISAALAACDQAIDLLQRAQKSDLPGGGNVFLETERKQLHTLLLHVQKKMEKIRTKNPIAPFINTLVEVAQDGINSDLFTTVIAMIQDLKNSLDEERTSSDTADAQDEQNSINAVASYDSTISSQKGAQQENETNLGVATGKIDELNTQIENFQCARDQADESLTDLNASCSANETAANEQITKLDEDIKAIESALTFLRSNQS